MCGRYTLYQNGELAERFKVRQPDVDDLLKDLRRRYNIAPTSIMPTITATDEGQNHIELMRWGFMPAWAQNPRDVFKYKTFNARSEDIFSKPTWKKAIRQRRCLVPCNGFYEWKATDSGKQTIT